MIAKQSLLGLLLCVPCSASWAGEVVYQGTWNTTNRKLDGTMTCVVSPVAKNSWQARFRGVWQGVAFDHTIVLSGSASDLRGKATIDGANYECRAWMNAQQLKANFSGDRYVGSFDLARDQTPRVSRK